MTPSTFSMSAEPTTPHEPRLRLGAPGARETLRCLLLRAAKTLHLTGQAVELLVRQAHVTNCRAGQRLLGPRDTMDFTYLVVSGAVRLDVGTGNSALTLAYVPPGQFLPFAAYGGPAAAPVSFDALVHVPSLVAVVSHETMRRAADLIGIERTLGLAQHELTRVAALTAHKWRLASSAIVQRVVAELAVLARDFGRPSAGGTLIDLPLVHADVARLVGASRANVTRALVGLRNAGRVGVVERRFVLRAPEERARG